MRLTRAVSELQFIEHSLKEVARVRTKDDPIPEVGEVLAAEEIGKLYMADQDIDADDVANADALPDDDEDVTANV